MHALYLSDRFEVLESAAYVILLFLVAPAFYLFLRGALQIPLGVRTTHLLFYAPALVAAWLDRNAAIPLAFVMGAGFALHLGVLVLRLRAQRERFRLEMAALALHAILALVILVLGVFSPLYGLRGFVVGYSIAIGLGFLLSVHVLLRFPDIVGKTAEAVTSAYAVSTLTRVDREQAARLNPLWKRAGYTMNREPRELAHARPEPATVVGAVNTQFGRIPGVLEALSTRPVRARDHRIIGAFSIACRRLTSQSTSIGFAKYGEVRGSTQAIWQDADTSNAFGSSQP